MKLTEEQVLALAPDESSKKSGRDLSNPSKWVSKGANERALWGQASGSGSKPYQSQVDIVNFAYKCSCPSRKFPCKHGLGLMLLYARHSEAFTNADAPAWVTDWLDKRTEKEERKSASGDKPVDVNAQAKRQESRERKVADGIEELQLWIKDIVRNGLINLPGKDYAFYDQVARRMVDAQAPGLASMVRTLSQVNFFIEHWQQEFLQQLLNIYLLCNAYKNKETLDANLVHDIRTGIGFTQSQDGLKEKPGLLDTWLVLSKQVSIEESLTVERYWLYGSTGRHALVLQFLFRGQGGEISLTPGMFVQAELAYFPSAFPLRAIIKRQASSAPVVITRKFHSIQQVVEREAAMRSTLPFSTARPYIVRQLTPALHHGKWHLADAENNLLPIDDSFRNTWKLLAISGGKPVDIAMIVKDKSAEPIGLWQHETYKTL